MIDWKRVDELRAEIGDEDFDEVVVLFLTEVEEVIERLKNAPDPATVGDDLHFLKGSAVNLGFATFGALCQAGEKKAAANQASEVDIAAVLTGYADSKDRFLNRARS